MPARKPVVAAAWQPVRQSRCPGSILAMPAWDVVGRINAEMLHAIAPVALSIVLVGSIATIMSNAGFEVQLDTTFDGDREMETAGIATLISGFFGGSSWPSIFPRPFWHAGWARGGGSPVWSPDFAAGRVCSRERRP